MSLASAFSDLAYGTPVHLIDTMAKARTAFDVGDHESCTDLLDMCAQDGFTTWHDRAAALAFDIAENAARGREGFY